jgi:hypothetical protein
MAAAHEFIRGVLHPSAESGADWEQIVHAMREVGREKTTESEALLLEVLAFGGEIRLRQDTAAPHAMSPADLMRADAIQTLARWDLRAHRPAIRAALDSAESHSLAFVAREWLRR